MISFANILGGLGFWFVAPVSISIVALAAGLVWHRREARRFRFETERAVALIVAESAEISLPPDHELPPVLREYVARSLARKVDANAVHLTQRGKMWMRPRADALDFEADQWIDLRSSAFVWKARFRWLGVARLDVVDRYVGGRGLLEGRLLGSIPVVRATGDGVDRGEAMRYLAELPWAPNAIVRNPALAWRTLGDRRAAVSIRVGGQDVSVVFDFDENGDRVSMTGLRPRRVGDEDVETEWRGTFARFRTISGHRLPTLGEVQWILEEGPFTYWRGELESYDSIA